MPTFEYFESKLVDVEARLDWINQKLSSIPSGVHPRLVSVILDYLSRSIQQVKDIENLLKTRKENYLPRIRILYQTLEGDLEKTSSAILGPLLNEGVTEKRLIPILCRICQEVGLAHVTDSLIKLWEPLATLPITDECPIFWMPYEITHSLRDWPALYHEAGHVFFSHDRAHFVGRLLSTVQKHFRQVILSAGPMPEPARSERFRAIQIAETYWTDVRLEELFCDCFATFWLGLAYPFTWTDTSFRLYSSPQQIVFKDEHPPPSARFDCVWYCLPDCLKIEPCGQLIRTIWDAYLAGTTPASNLDSLLVNYSLACSPELLQALAQESLHLIRSTLNCVQYDHHVPAPNEAVTLNPSEPLTKLFNAAMSLLLLEPISYRAFQDRLLRDLISNQS